MADPSPLVIEFTKIVPVVAGAVLALTGGFVSQLVTFRLNRKAARDALVRERAEALARALYADGLWLSERQNVILFREKDHDAPSPLGEAQMLQKLYFPSLQAELLAVMQARIPMLTFIGEQRIAQMKDKAAWIAAWNPEPFHSAYKDYISAVDKVVTKCRAQIADSIGA